MPWKYSISPLLVASTSHHCCHLKKLPVQCFSACVQLVESNSCYDCTDGLLQIQCHWLAPNAGHFVSSHMQQMRYLSFPTSSHASTLSVSKAATSSSEYKKEKGESTPLPLAQAALSEHSMQAATKSSSCTSSSAVAVLCGSCRGSDIHLGTSPRDSG